jgi:hypothetical protein
MKWEHMIIIRTKSNDGERIDHAITPIILFDQRAGIEFALKEIMTKNENALTESKQARCKHEFVEVLKHPSMPYDSKRCKLCGLIEIL